MCLTPGIQARYRLQRTWAASLALPSAAYKDCLIVSGQLYVPYSVVLGGHPMTLASPKCWDHYFMWTVPSTASSRLSSDI